MRLNTIAPAEGSRREKVRLGRGIGSGMGKTSGRGHKGQRSRAGGYHKVGFEGGQMPLQRRLPKVGFIALKSLLSAEVRTSELNKIEGGIVTLETLKAANVLRHDILHVKIILSGEVNRAFEVRGIRVTKGAAQAITAAGGKVE
ncbi:MAG: 50S ribosomal protein L15 [Halothiobacillaceae bacterium]|nr:50S ribosomal protein L15 [Halothiobacillaceae bacterium]